MQQSAPGYLRAQFHIPQIVRPIEHPNVIVLIDREPRNAPQFPFIRQRFGPVGIKLVFGRSHRLRSDSGAPKPTSPKPTSKVPPAR